MTVHKTFVAAPQTPPEAWQQAHVDIGALAQRVTGVEGTLQQIWGALGDLSKKLDSKPTNWWGIIGGIVGLLTILGTVFVQAMQPVNGTLERHDHEIAHISENALRKDDYFRAHDALQREVKEMNEKDERWIASLRDRLRDDEDHAITQRQFSELKERLDERYKITEAYAKAADESAASRITALDAQVVKRPEIEAANHSQDERITALSTRMNAIQAQVDAMFPASKVIDELWRGLAEVRTSAAPVKPAGPP